MIEKTTEGMMKTALRYQVEKGVHHQSQENNSKELVNLTLHYQLEKETPRQLWKKPTEELTIPMVR